MQEFSTATGMVRGQAVEFKASAAETASTTQAQFDTGADQETLYLIVAVTAASGTTPTMSLVVEGSMDNGTNWFTLGTIGANGYNVGSVATAPTNFTTTATVRALLAVPQLVRVRSVIGGTTPSFTYSVEGVLG
jgi:UDP-N-acetylmuramyl tripeptide synthase